MPRISMSRLGLLWRFYVQRSVALDAETARLRHFSARLRAAFLADKARAVLALRAADRAVVRVGAYPTIVTSLIDLGSLQSCLADVHDTVAASGRFAGERPVVVDIGANIGQFLSAITAIAPRADVLCVEPDPDVFRTLAENASARPHARAVCAAAGAQAGTLTLHRHHVTVMSTLRPGAVETYDPARQLTVPVRTVDELTAGLDAIDLLKIDVEGFEQEVLDGATATLGRTRLLLLELGLARDDAGGNLEVLATVHRRCPQARIIRVGRPLGGADDPICQDLLIDLHPDGERTS